LPWFYTDLADALLEKRESEEAIASYIKGIELQPDFYPAYNQLRAIHSFKLLKLTETQLEDLVNCYRQAIKVKPDFAEHYVNLGNILSQTNKIEEARVCYQKAISYKTRLSHPELGDRSSEELREPNFIIIGTIKGGTSSLYNYISTHPQVLPAIQKEVHFFDTHFNKGIDWYLAHFPAIPTDKNFLTGEASPNYMYFEKGAKRLFNYFPKTQLIVILRNPIDRVVSHYYMAKRQGQEERTLEEVIAKEQAILKKIENNPKANVKLLEPARGYLSFSLYLYFLKKWIKLFPKEQFLILQSEDMYEQPEETMKQVFDFLELPDYQINQYRKYCPGSYSPIDESTRQTLSELFQPHNQRLEKYLGRKFNW
jgi:tetratricopeptide (TPR) repeat protein